MHTKSAKSGGVSPDEGVGIATQALAYIAGDWARLGRFLAESGLGPENLRQAARDPSFLPAVLDFILSHERKMNSYHRARK